MLPSAGALEPDAFPPSQRVADGVVHCLGLAAVLAGVGYLFRAGLAHSGWRTLLAVAAYLSGLAASFVCSAAYNMAPEGRWQRRLRRFDHAAIFLLIAGTYTPVVAFSLPRAWSISLLALVWTGAAGGVGLKLFAPGRHERLGLALYLLLGWVGLVALPPLLAALSSWQLAFLGFGAVLYTGGVLFHLAHRLPFHDALWHGSVLAASVSHYLLVLTLTLPGA